MLSRHNGWQYYLLSLSPNSKFVNSKIDDPEIGDFKIEDSEIEDSEIKDSDIEDSNSEDSDIEDSEIKDSEIEDSKIKKYKGSEFMTDKLKMFESIVNTSSANCCSPAIKTVIWPLANASKPPVIGASKHQAPLSCTILLKFWVCS